MHKFFLCLFTFSWLSHAFLRSLAYFYMVLLYLLSCDFITRWNSIILMWFYQVLVAVMCSSCFTCFHTFFICLHIILLHASLISMWFYHILCWISQDCITCIIYFYMLLACLVYLNVTFRDLFWTSFSSYFHIIFHVLIFLFNTYIYEFEFLFIFIFHFRFIFTVFLLIHFHVITNCLCDNTHYWLDAM